MDFEVDLTNARRHREMDKAGTEAYYLQQDRIVRATPLGQQLPREVRQGGDWILRIIDGGRPKREDAIIMKVME